MCRPMRSPVANLLALLMIWYFATWDGKAVIGPFGSLEQCQKIRSYLAQNAKGELLLAQPLPCCEVR